jgi:hypothetical protein
MIDIGENVALKLKHTMAQVATTEQTHDIR